MAGLAGGLLVSPMMMHWTQSAPWLVQEEVLKMNSGYWHWPLGVLLPAVFHAPQGLAALFERRGVEAGR